MISRKLKSVAYRYRCDIRRRTTWPRQADRGHFGGLRRWRRRQGGASDLSGHGVSDLAHQQQSDSLQEKRNRLEAILFLAREPLSSRKLSKHANLADGTEARTLVRQLKKHLDATGRAFTVQEVAGGFQLTTRSKYAKWLRRLGHVPAEERLSAPAMETLAVVAYRQPIIRAEIESVRGVSCGEILNQLMTRDLIRVSGRSDDLGRPYLYNTTKRFLQVFGLRALEDLPSVQLFGNEASIGTDSPEVQEDNDVSDLIESSTPSAPIAPPDSTQQSHQQIHAEDEDYDSDEYDYDDDDDEDDDVDDDVDDFEDDFEEEEDFEDGDEEELEEADDLEDEEDVDEDEFEEDFDDDEDDDEEEVEDFEDEEWEEVEDDDDEEWDDDDWEDDEEWDDDDDEDQV